MSDIFDPITPGEILREDFMIPLEISAYKLAKATHITQTRISQILSGKRSITPDTALRFGKYFGTTPAFWLNIQRTCDLDTARDKLAGELETIEPFTKVTA